MQNESGENVDLYIPRKCSASNRIIHAKDYASIQLNIAEVDEATGRYTGNNVRYAICGDIRRMGESDECISRLGKRDGFLPNSASNRIIHAKDYASIQLNIAEVDEATGRYTGNNVRYAVCGDIRRMGESDDCISRLGKRDGFLPKSVPTLRRIAVSKAIQEFLLSNRMKLQQELLK